jgi:hemerythrin
MSFVRALEIPCGLFQEFVRRNNLFRAVSRVVELREFLLRTWLFGEVISTSTLNAISQGMRRRNFQAGEAMELGHEKLGLVASGRAGRFIGENRVETLAACDFFNEEASVFGTPSLFRVRALEPTEVYEVPAELVRRIPSVRWKLFEGSSRRMRALSETEQTQRMLLHWHEEYSVNIQRIDNHHRRLFEIGNTVLDAVESEKPVAEVAEAFGLMVEYALFHFAEEEALLERYGYPELDTHRHRHQRLVVAMNELFERIQRGSPVISAELLVFLQDWLVTHILREDRRYVSFLNGRGVY